MKTMILYSLLFLPFISISQRVGADHAQLGMIRDSITTNSRILLNPQLYVVTEDGKLSNYYSVLKFTLAITNPAGELLLSAEMTGGNKLTNHQRSIIRDLAPGSKLKFEEIIGTCPDCRNVKLPPLTIRIQ